MEQPNEIMARIVGIADKIDRSSHPSRKRVASEIRDVIAAVERIKDKGKKERGKPRKEVDTSIAATMHMNLLDRYRDFHDTGANLIGFRSVLDGVPVDSSADVAAAGKECEKAFKELDTAIRNARGAYSALMAALAKI